MSRHPVHLAPVWTVQLEVSQDSLTRFRQPLAARGKSLPEYDPEAACIAACV
jgi:hypothetical protein